MAESTTPHEVKVSELVDAPIAQKRTTTTSRLAWGCGLLFFLAWGLYGGAYVGVRATHRLVRYSGGFIARPNVISGIGWSLEELLFAPLCWLEQKARGPA